MEIIMRLLRVKTTVLPGHRIELSSPELNEGEAVDVIIEHEAPKRAEAHVSRRQLLDMPVAERRTILMRQAELLQDEYLTDPE